MMTTEGFTYSVQSLIDRDCYFSHDNDIVFRVLPDGKGLVQDNAIKLKNGTYIPAHKRVNVSLQVTYDYDDFYSKKQRFDLEKLNTFFKRRLEEIDGFVVLDRKNRYEIRFPNGWRQGLEARTEQRQGK